jgi:two-component system, NtrC family, sensor kinase
MNPLGVKYMSVSTTQENFEASEFIVHITNHVGDFPMVVLDDKKNVVSYTQTFLDFFDIEEAQLLNHPFPSHIHKFTGQSHGYFDLLHPSLENIKISYLVSYFRTPSDETMELITFKDLSYSILKENLKKALIKITHTVNSSEDISKMLNKVLRISCTSMGFQCAFICLYDQVNESFDVTAQVGLKDLYQCHLCNRSKKSVETKRDQKSFSKPHRFVEIHYGPLSNHPLKTHLNSPQIDPEKSSILHIPLNAEGKILGTFHMIGPSFTTKQLSKEKDILHLIAHEISVGIKRIRLVKDIKQYADNLEKIITIRTDQLREKDAQLIQSGKLATLGELATGIAHEINQPLGGISLITQGLMMAKSRGKLDSTLLDEKLRDIIEQIERINNIITHLRTFARQTDNIKVEIDIRKPLLDVFKLIGQQLVNKEIEVVLDIPEEIPLILAEHNRMEQIFLNLLGNAKDAIEDMEKRIQKEDLVSTLAHGLKNWRKKIIIKAYSSQEHLILEFKDNGTGIPHTIIHKIFDPFFTTKEIGRGTGIGLSITYGIVRDFNGVIQVESEENRGSKFIIKFPLAHGKTV